MTNTQFSSSHYWENRYRTGGNSGAGSYGRLSAFKASFINSFIAANDVRSVIEFGCGDGNQLSQLTIPDYVGVDVSPRIVEHCRARFADMPGRRFVTYDDLHNVKSSDLVMSLDVIFHLVEDAVFERYISHLFMMARRYVIFYSSNYDQLWPNEHVRHRKFTAFVEEFFPDWRLAAHIPNIYPYDPKDPDHTSFADFYVFRNPHQDCVVSIPALAPKTGAL
jgi:SAM-dependent methyltransferase